MLYFKNIERDFLSTFSDVRIDPLPSFLVLRYCTTVKCVGCFIGNTDVTTDLDQ